VRDGFGRAGSALDVCGCYWGDLGRSSGYRGVSIPGFVTGRRGINEEAAVENNAGLLAILLEDPLAELLVLRDVEKFTLEGSGSGFRPVPENVELRNQALRAAEQPVVTRITTRSSSFTNMEDSLAADQVARLAHDVFETAAAADRSLDVVALCAPVARAITAELYQLLGGEDALAGGFCWNRTVEVVESALEAQLGGQRGMFKSFAATSLTLALRHGLRNRIMPGLSLFLGDVFAWFRNREAILQRVDEAVRIARHNSPLVLVGHSLGGVIAFEYCLQADREVQLLATVGSQVGLFGELGVLHPTTPTTAGALSPPAKVAMWRNIYDPNDALSFCAAPIFTGVSDIELDTGAPFPVSHSEYWNLPNTYAKLVIR